MTSLPRNWLLHGLHLALGLSLPLIMLFLFGCMKAKAKREDLGPEVSSEVIDRVLANASAGASLSTLAVDQYLDFSYTRRIENSEVDINMGTRHVQVLDRQDKNGQARFTIHITDSSRRADNTFQILEREEDLWLNKIPKSASTANLLLMTTPELANAMHTAPSTVKTTFHHLGESDGVVEVPLAVSGRAGCGGISPCLLPVHYVQFDMAVWQDATNYQKISIDFAFNTKTPYIPFGSAFDQLTGSIIVDCRSTYVPVEGHSVYVRDCSTLDNFQK